MLTTQGSPFSLHIVAMVCKACLCCSSSSFLYLKLSTSNCKSSCSSVANKTVITRSFTTVRSCTPSVQQIKLWSHYTQNITLDSLAYQTWSIKNTPDLTSIGVTKRPSTLLKVGSSFPVPYFCAKLHLSAL